MTHMKRIKMVVCVLVAITLLVTLLSGSAFATSANDLRKIVTFKNLDLKTLLGYATALGVVTTSGSTEVHKLWLINALAVELPANDLMGALASLLGSPYVVGVFDDLLTLIDPICPTLAPPPIQESYPWGLQRVDVPDVHQQWPELKGSGVTVAIVDTGIDPTHVEFSKRIAGGYNARPGGGSYVDDHGHGTHMAGIITAAMNSLGIISAAPKAKLAAVKALDQNGAGYISDAINGLQWVYNNGIPLVNMSFGFSTPSTPLRQAIQALKDSGIIMVASAGNRCAAAPTQEDGGGDCQGGPAAVCSAERTAVMYPAAYPGVIAVAATTMYDEIADYSLEGNEVDVAAPGGERGSGAQPDGRILSTNRGGGYGLGYGTSQAAAHVSGAAALVLQVQPGLSPEQVRDLLKTTAEELDGYQKTQQGNGLINVMEMILALP